MKVRSAGLQEILGLPRMATEGIAYKLGGAFFIAKPRFVCFPVTFLCNSRCQMCNIWMEERRGPELDLAAIERIFSNRLFNKVEQVVLHGGEPTLRKDIDSIYKILFQHCRGLDNIALSTNGLEPDLVDKRVAAILDVGNPRKVKLIFTISIDGPESAHETIRGIPGAFNRALRTVSLLKKHQKKYPIQIDIITVIQPQNVENLEEMITIARRLEVGLIFQPLTIDPFYRNSAVDPRLCFSDAQLDTYRTFIQQHLACGRSPRSLYWRNYLEMMNGGRRRIPCAYDRYVLSLYPTGEVLPCSKESPFGIVHDAPVDRIWFGKDAEIIRDRMRQNICPTCSFYCGAEYSLRKEFFTYALDFLKCFFKRSDS